MSEILAMLLVPPGIKWIPVYLCFFIFRRKWQPTPVSLPGESHRQRSQAGYSLWGRKETRLSDFTFFFICKMRVYMRWLLISVPLELCEVQIILWTPCLFFSISKAFFFFNPLVGLQRVKSKQTLSILNFFV